MGVVGQHTESPDSLQSIPGVLSVGAEDQLHYIGLKSYPFYSRLS